MEMDNRATDDILEDTMKENEIFSSQYKIILWKLYITARRRYIRTFICLVSPLIMVAMFSFAFSDSIVSPELCAYSDFPVFITLDIYTSFGYLLHIVLIVYRLVGEKYHQRQILLFVMGCKKSSYYLSNVTFDLIITLAMATYLAISLKYLVLTCSYLPFLIITYILHGLQTVAFCYMFCYNCLFNTESQPPSTWITIFILIWTISKTFRIVLEFQFGTPKGILNTIVTMLNCMLPQPALFESGKQVIFNKELRFNGLFTHQELAITGPQVPLGYVWLSMLGTIIIYFVISWLYLRDDHESESSSPSEEKNIIISKESTYQTLPSSKTDTYLALDRNNPENLVNLSQLLKSNLLVEDEPSNLKRGIIVKDVCKWFPSKSHGGYAKVVDDLSLTVYEGQITILLGHNGAGKTTLMELITGLRHSNSGEIAIAGNLSNGKKSRHLARLSVGYCPQSSIVFPELTVLEHLQLFCGIKSFQTNEENNKMIEAILTSVRLLNKKNNLVDQLSGGMVRKLSLAIALVGAERQVLILDEPSSGLDPESRESIWDIIRIYGRSKAILITTQHMEEADHLGDRIAIMSRGKIVCCGSNVFLKDLLGNGYIIRLALKTNSISLGSTESNHRFKVKQYMRELITKCLVLHNSLDSKNQSLNELKMLVRQIYSAIQQQSSQEEIDDSQDLTIAIDDLYDITNTHTPELNYEKFFQDVEDSQSTLNIESFGIASSTMEDVFNNISVMANICYGTGTPRIGERPLIPVFIGAINDETKILAIDRRSTTEAVHIDSIRFNLASTDTITGYKLAIQHIKVTVLRHIIIFRNNMGSYFGQRFLYLILVYFVMVIIVRIRARQHISIQQKVTTFTIYSTVPFFLAFMASHYIHLSNRDKVIDGSKFLQHMSGLSPIVYWPIQYLFDLPSMILNAIILVLCIKWIDFTQPFTNNSYYTTWDIWISITFLVVGFSSASALFSYSVSAYFNSSAMALVTMAMYHSATFFVACVAMIFKTYSEYSYSLYVFWATLLNPGFALVDGIRKFYDTANFYQDANANQTISKLKLGFSNNSDIAKVIEKSRKLEIKYLKYQPNSFSSINSINNDLIDRSKDRSRLFTNDMDHGVYINFESIILWNLLGFLLVVLDEFNYNPFDLSATVYNKYISPPIVALRLWLIKIKSRNVDPGTQSGLSDVEINKKLIEADISVGKEEARVATLILKPRRVDNPTPEMAHKRLLSVECLDSADSKKLLQTNRKGSMLPLLASELHKSYRDFVAVDCLSLALNYEECLGLLGINGAGKSTTFSMISTRLTPDRGQLRCLGHCPEQQLHLYRKQIGYDPQMSVTFYDLTCRQTLRHMAQLRGMRNGPTLDRAVESLMRIFNMEEHADKLMNQLSGGTKRKLSLALAMICTPPVLLLDEPTAGVDPLSRRSIWHCIANCKRRHNCSIVISSHAMEECEAICDRIALMANGRLYCLGSFQQLRKKYSQGYVIRVQLHQNLKRQAMEQSTQEVEPHEQILSAIDISDRLTLNLRSSIPSLKVEYSNNSIIIFRITDCNEARSKLFHLMDKESKRFSGQISYLINDTSLEDVFLTFARCFDEQTQTSLNGSNTSDSVIQI